MKLKNNVLYLILIIGTLATIYFGIRIGMSIYKYYQNDKANLELNSYVEEIIEEELNENPSISASYSFDWEGLREYNKDIIGWIKIDDTSIDYPIVQGNDNDYYLHHQIDGTDNYYVGSVFMDYKNASDFTDSLNVIYAHHCSDGSMFNNLTKYKDQEFYESHPLVHLYTPENEYIVELIAGCYMDGTQPFLQFEFIDNIDYLTYLSEYIKQSTFKSNITINSNDQILMLSTCDTISETARYVVIGKMIKVEKEG